MVTECNDESLDDDDECLCIIWYVTWIQTKWKLIKYPCFVSSDFNSLVY